jgi:hypothetical protein
MSIQDIKDSQILKKCFSKIGGRKGISERAMEICKKVTNGREAVFAIGRMASLYQVCKADDYWDEKASKGKRLEWYAVQQAAENGGDFSKAVDAFGDEKL